MRNSKGLRPKVASGTDLAESTPKRQATGSNPAGGAKNDRCKPFFDGLQRFFVIVSSGHSCRSAGTILYIFRCMPANWLQTIVPILSLLNQVVEDYHELLIQVGITDYIITSRTMFEVF